MTHHEGDYQRAQELAKSTTWAEGASDRADLTTRQRAAANDVTTGTTTDETPTNNRAQEPKAPQHYTVQAGDAFLFDAIAQANGITDPNYTLKAGEQLTIPDFSGQNLAGLTATGRERMGELGEKAVDAINNFNYDGLVPDKGVPNQQLLKKLETNKIDQNDTSNYMRSYNAVKEWQRSVWDSYESVAIDSKGGIGTMLVSALHFPTEVGFSFIDTALDVGGLIFSPEIRKSAYDGAVDMVGMVDNASDIFDYSGTDVRLSANLDYKFGNFQTGRKVVIGTDVAALQYKAGDATGVQIAERTGWNFNSGTGEASVIAEIDFARSKEVKMGPFKVGLKAENRMNITSQNLRQSLNLQATWANSPLSFQIELRGPVIDLGNKN